MVYPNCNCQQLWPDAGDTTFCEYIMSDKMTDTPDSRSKHSKPRRLRSFVLGALCMTMAVAVSPTSTAGTSSGFAIVINAKNSTGELSTEALSRIFMKKTKSWGDGIPILPVDLGGSSKTRKAFSVAVHGRSASAVKNNWQRQVFTGRGTPPPELQSEDDVVAYVRFNKGAIGYVSTNTALDGVRIVTLTD
jgi:hypothetical protein